MELRINTNVGTAGQTVPQSKATPPVKAPSPDFKFSAAEALETALTDVPAVRPEAVRQARLLAADASYPSAEALGRVASLLAKNWAAKPE